MLLPAGPAPHVTVRPLACRPTARADRWRCAWEITNEGPEALWLVAAWLPHGRFRAPQRAYTPPRSLPPGATIHLERVVSCEGAAGEVVENAFLILRVDAADSRPWRVLARLTIRFDAARRPNQHLALLTCQPVGFAQSSDRPHRGEERGNADDRA
ncbi:MAG: hypothetical protein IRZ14_00360 [Chloroflexi bacterium]|nr:hypothetical protein [Chloroflexota bacterium]